MHGRTKIILWIALVFSIAFGGAVKLFPLHIEQNRLQRLPFSGSLFSSQQLPLSTSELSFFGQAKVIKRFYRYGKHNFIMIVVDGSENRHAIHDPLYCLRGAGWEINSRETISVDGGRADLLRLSWHGFNREAIFWFSDGMTRHASIIRYWMQATLRRLLFGLSDPEPVMVILQSADNENPDWRSILDQCGFLFEI